MNLGVFEETPLDRDSPYTMASSISIPTQGVQGFAPQRPLSTSSGGSKAGNSVASKRITTPHACAECKRRKIRCDGQQPCGQCLSSRTPKRCFYDKHRQRVIPSRKTLEALSQSLEECRSLLKRLYPVHEISSLLPLSRRDLISLLDQTTSDSATSLPSPPVNLSPYTQDLTPSLTKDFKAGLQSRERIPSCGAECDEERRQTDPLPLDSDDIHALCLTTDRNSSHIGASSIKAALMVMLKVQPRLQTSLTPPCTGSAKPSNLPLLRRGSTESKESNGIPWSWKRQTLIDAYFKRIHVFIPMLNEASFRSDYLDGLRSDPPWLALVNMVFAMGSIVAMKSDDFNHINYYNHAMEHLTIDAFGSTQIETIQALAIAGGYYLHYVNRPHVANAVIGAAIRMAGALGLHREYEAQAGCDDDIAEMKRRTWWSLFCLDTWATTTMDRPSLGRWDQAINIRPPEFGVHNSCDSAQHAGILPLIENIKFCKVATQIQNMLTSSPIIRAGDLRALDKQLISWYDNLPWLLRTTDPCPEPLYIARCIMKWRYQNLRMLLHRPVLLGMANKQGSASQAEEIDMSVVEVCREMAKATVEDIAREWARNQMSGWNAVWFLYQAAMIPLVSILWQRNSPHVHEWKKQVETIIELLDAMEDWSLTARHSRDVVLRMYEASRESSTPPKESSVYAPDVGQNVIMRHSDDVHVSLMDIEADDIVGMLDQYGMWDLDGLSWEHPERSSESENGIHGVNEDILQMDYPVMGIHECSIDPSFFTH